ncbi:hypothetical protein [Anaerosolibacter sp.]|uniref:hypothetical protein n=1 Tax=Anaerosolibacter sp. TaxID=1872527 RepID=UPI0039F04F08
MGVLYNLVARRNRLFNRYCELRQKEDKTIDDQRLMSSIVAKIAVLDEEIEYERGTSQ